MKIKQSVQQLLHRYLDSDIIPFSKICALFWPILFDTVSVAFMSVLSSSMVSSSGEEAVAAVNMVESVNLFFTNFYIAIATGGTVVVAQYIGHQDHPAAGRASAQALLSALGLSLTIAISLIVFSSPVVHLLFGKAEPLVLEYGRTYLICCALSYPFYAIYQVALGTLRGSGDTRASMVLSILLNFTFLAGNFLLINVLKLGVLGSGISLIFCRLVISVLAMIYLLYKRRDLQIRLRSFLRFDPALQRSILYIGLPTALEQIFFHGGKIITQTFVVSLGTVFMTANAVTNSLFNLILSPASAVNVLVVTVVGYCIGAKRPEEGRRLLRSLAMAASVVHIGVSLLVLPLLQSLIGIYHVSPEAAAHITRCMFIVMVMIPLIWPFAFIVPSGLRAAGDARYTSLIALSSMWLVRVTLGYLLGIVLPWNVEGIWLAMCLEWVVRGTIFGIRLRGEKWYQHKLIDN